MKNRLQRLFEGLNKGLIERETPLKLALLSALAGEHTLLLGAHGTAKSVLAQRLHLAFKEGDYFERLLTRFSVPEELFGPLSIKSLENDRYQRLTKHYLPSSTIAFIDEIFKANSAILNSLLTILNERRFDNGDVRLDIPLISVIAASNELPEEASLAALYDRFLCRYQVEHVSTEHFAELLSLSDTELEAPNEKDRLTAKDVFEIQQQATQLPLSDEVIELLHALRLYVKTIALYVSDRRWRKVVKLLKVAAYTNGHDHVGLWDCWLLQHCLWDEPEQRKLIANWFQSQLGMGSGFNFGRLNKLVATWEKVLQSDANSEVPLLNQQGLPLYTTSTGEQSIEASYLQRCERKGSPLYLAPPDQGDRSLAGQGCTYDELLKGFFDDRYQQTHVDGKWQHINDYISDSSNRLVIEKQNTPCLLPKQHEANFITGRLRELTHLQQDIQQFDEKLSIQLANVEVNIGEHLWLDPIFIETAAASLNKSTEQVQSLLSRLETLLNGYQCLPVKEA